MALSAFQPRAFQPAFQQISNVGAGRRTRPRPQRFIIRIDGQEFVCQTMQEVYDLLRRAREAAELFSVQRAEQVANAVRDSAEPVELPSFDPPKIEINTREIRAAVNATKRDISETYRKAVIDMELRMIFELDKRADEQEDSILLLM